MAEPQKPAPLLERSSRAFLAFAIVGNGGFFVLVYYMAADLIRLFTPRSSSLLQVIIAIPVVAPAVYSSITSYRDIRKKELARKANAQVADQLNKLGRAAAAVPTKQVTDSLKDVKVDPAQLNRIVEQLQQKRLIDDDYFRAELRDLIVTYLQPLPRNAKRLVNRFRVNLLIANRRELLTSKPEVTPRQIGKWMVLLERWPQLGRALSAVPEKMQTLEDQAAVEPKPLADQVQQNTAEASSASASAAQAVSGDAFMQTVKSLAEPYIGDEDLRKFIHSEPSLAPILSRLIHYGTAETTA